jgi:crossover junction endodeoxyribonuclease RuvC
MKRKILALDPSLRAFGWAVVEVTKKGKTLKGCGCIQTDTIKASLKTDSDTARLATIASVLQEVILKYKPELIVFENPVGSKSSRANQALSFVKGLVISAAIFSKLPYYTIRAKTAKKGTTGETNADKGQVMETVIVEFPEFEVLTDKWSKVKKYAASDAAAVFLGWKLDE